MLTGSIFAAVSFLEATVNELFADAVDNSCEVIKPLNPDVKALMADIWELIGPRKAFSILDKFRIALILARKQPFNAGASPYQDIDSLIRLRNALVHYKPEWVTAGSDTNQNALRKIEQRLRGKFPLNPLTSDGDPFFPKRCLSHGCAEWAVRSSVKFADEFYSRMGLTPTFNHIRSHLETK